MKRKSHADISFLRKHYKYIVAWGNMLRSDYSYVTEQVIAAQKDGASEKAIYRKTIDSLEWVEVSEKTESLLKPYLEN